MTDEESKPRTLEDVTAELGDADERWKGGEEDRNARKSEFFTLATEALKAQTLAQKTVSVGEFDSIPEAETWISRHYPTWRLVDIELLDDESDVVAILEENPELQEFVYTNPRDGKTYKRQIVSGSSLIDEEQLREEDPELWERITFTPEPEPQIKTNDDIEPKDLAKMQRYMYVGKPQVKLPAPKKAKEQSDDDA